MADAVVAQMLPDGAVKGGSALKLRFGDAGTRFGEDLDTARASGVDEYIGVPNTALEEGWQGFTGAAVRREPAMPTGAPAAYVMQPYDVKLSYLGKSWVTVPLEVGHNEIGDADDPDMIVPKDAATLFEALGSDPPSPVPVMRLSHQIAQKLHGLPEEGSKRAHDLVDLQLISLKGQIDLARTRETCERLFAYRGSKHGLPRLRPGRIGHPCMQKPQKAWASPRILPRRSSGSTDSSTRLRIHSAAFRHFLSENVNSS